MALEVQVDGIPDELKAIDRWIAWKEVPRKNKDGKTTINKVAVGDNGYPCKWLSCNTWKTFAGAYRQYKTNELAGIGIVLTGEDGLFGLDLDDSYSTDKMQDATYTELSPSGKGLRSLGYVENVDISAHPKGLGLFTHNRWLSVTGHRVSSVGYLADCTKTVEHFLGNLANRGKSNGKGALPLVTLPHSQLTELVRENRRFAALWNFENVKNGVIVGYDSYSELDAAVEIGRAHV